MSQASTGSPNFPQMEAEIARFWKERSIYEKSLKRRLDEKAPPFVFYEGPPTANGLPHPGHCLTRAIKDLFPRYKTMRGFACERKAGWDTHGLPVEVEVCKELGIHSKEEIESYGVEPFIHKCIESVFRYTREWERLTDRLGFWIHLDEAYVTYHQSYVESVWWALKNLFDRGLLYQGHKIVWWWAQGGTALSSGEVGQGYREVADPSVYVKFPLLDKDDKVTDESLLVWTTTPWTLPSNQFAAVHPELDYAVISDPDGDGKLIIAAALVEIIAGKVKQELSVESTFKGKQLIERRYRPPFDNYYAISGNQKGRLKSGGEDFTSWRVVGADFVTIDSGTGIVHQAPAFGEVDFEVLVSEQARFADRAGPELINAVGPDGKFTEEGPEYCRGRWVKDCDKDITRDLRQRGLLFHQEQYLHDYPFCWRAEEDPLIQYPRRSWFVRTTQFKDRLLANNQEINWQPAHIKSGRFGNFLESNVDWALSRERYWGTPLPIWVCEKTGRMEAVASYQELMNKPGVTGMQVWKDAKKKNPELSDHLKIHKPYIDAVTYDSPFASGAIMRRVPEVIDCWFDSGAMPFAQWGYPHQGKDRFESQFPADFISEAIDQTRGWFYSQLAVSTLLFSDKDSRDAARPYQPWPHPFRNCVVLGLMLGEDGNKMSKSKRNYREPQEIFDRYGADALRWYFFANQPPWTSIRYSEQAIKDSIPEFLLRLWNVYSFFRIYADIDEFVPETFLDGEADELTPDVLANATGYQPPAERAELDRWVLSELYGMVRGVNDMMDAYDCYGACAKITQFVDGLSNWYVRRSRDRFWSSEKNQAKMDAYWTLYESLVATSKAIAPFVPFLAESMWQELVAKPFQQRATESVHLCDFPQVDGLAVDEKLSARMGLVREIASLGRSARMGAKLKVRQPLSKVEVILADTSQQPWLDGHAGLICEELNVKEVEFTKEAGKYITYEVSPNFPRLGPRLGKLMPKMKAAIAKRDGSELLKELESKSKVTIRLDGESVELDAEDIQVRLQAKEGWAAAQGANCVVVLSAELDEALIAEGLAREIVHAIQNRRKELGCEYTDRIAVGLVSDDCPLKDAIANFHVYVSKETLANRLEWRQTGEDLTPKADDASDPFAAEPIELHLGGHALTMYAKVLK